MISVTDYFARHRAHSPPWRDTAPVREEIFGVERLEKHAESLAAAQPVTTKPRPVASLHTRLNRNAKALLKAYRASAGEVERGRDVVPAAEWLLDNYHLVEAQIREIRNDLPPGYYRQLPKLAEGPFAGYPRVFGLAWALVAHTDSHFDPVILRRFIAAYQRIQPLTIGELWAVAITLRIVLIENLRRLTDQIIGGQASRADADALANRLLVSGDARSALETDILTRSSESLSTTFAAQLAKRLRDQDPKETPALGWLEERLGLQGQSIDGAVQDEQRSRGASNVTVRNIITSMRLISDIDWAEWFESVSLVDQRLCAESVFAAMDFPTRNTYRSAIEELACGATGGRRGSRNSGGGACRRSRLSPDRQGQARAGADNRISASCSAVGHPPWPPSWYRWLCVGDPADHGNLAAPRDVGAFIGRPGLRLADAICAGRLTPGYRGGDCPCAPFSHLEFWRDDAARL
jgi:cyclic beta-1,2-glucan synthetase